MKQCAVVLNGNDVVKVSNLKRKYDKIMSNHNMKILEECDKEMLDEKYNYWNRTLNRNIEEEKNEEAKLHYFRNPKTGCTIASIYPGLEKCKSYIKGWMDYVKLD